MNKATVLIFLCLFFPFSGQLLAQPVPAEYSWTDFPSVTGYDGTRPAIRQCHSFFDLLDSLNLPQPREENGHYVIGQELIDLLKEFGRTTPNPDTLDVLYFPEGIYEVDKMIVISTHNLVIKGAGAGKTIFNWTGDRQYCFNAIGKDSLSAGGVPVSGNEQAFSFTMPEDQLSFQAGDWAVLTRNDPGEGCDSTFMRQFLRVSEVAGGEVQFEEPLRIRYDATEDAARVHKLVPLQNIGFEDFTVDGSFNTYAGREGSMHSNLIFQFVVNSWVRGVESYKPAYQHLILNKASNIEVFGCYFHDSHEFSGGRGYGVNLQNGAGECRIENNIFATLRHAIVIQRGANGNAIAYNYCTDSKDGNGEDDLIFHGGYDFRNLAEGNSVEHLHFDLRQCNNGPYNVVFRNQVRKKNVQAGSWPLGAGEKFCVVGNESAQCISLVGSDHESWDNEEYGTWCGNKHGDDGVDEEIGASLLYADQPDWLAGSSWPVFGPGREWYGTIPAESRYLTDAPNTIPSYIFECAPPSMLEVTAETQPCQILPGTATKVAGRIELKIEGGVPPYSIEWMGVEAQVNATTALFFESGHWTAVVTDQAGETKMVSGHLEDCQEEDLAPTEALLIIPYERPLEAVIYPNPARGRTFLETHLYQPAILEAEILATDGRQVWELQETSAFPAGKHGFEIRTDEWASGVYLVRLQAGDEVKFLRLLVK